MKNQTFAKFGLLIKKNAPDILIGAGTVGVIAGAIMACKASTKASSILEKAKNEVSKADEVLADETLRKKYEYTEEEHKQDTIMIYRDMCVEYIKLYAPSVGIGMISLFAILKGNGILRKRHLGLMAAYTAIDQGFKDYRGRVKDELGSDMDRHFLYGTEMVEVEVEETDKKGNKKTIKKKVEVVDKNNLQGYTAIFSDKHSCYWDEDVEYSKMFIRSQLNYANELLQARGYLFLNEVLVALGISPTEAGQQVGWIYDEHNPVGDNYVDFGVFEDENKWKPCVLIDGDPAFLLDFNCDGYILNKAFDPWTGNLKEKMRRR